MGYVSSRNSDDLTSPDVAYERAHELCRKAVMLEKMSTVYAGSAIQSLTRRGQFGSWLRKLFHGEKVSIHLHYYERLIRIVEELAKSRQEDIDALDGLIERAKGRTDAPLTRNRKSSEAVSRCAPQAA